MKKIVIGLSVLAILATASVVKAESLTIYDGTKAYDTSTDFGRRELQEQIQADRRADQQQEQIDRQQEQYRESNRQFWGQFNNGNDNSYVAPTLNADPRDSIGQW